MTKRRWLLPLLLSLPLAAVVLFLGGCLPVGLGDPEASKVDPNLAGVWQESKDGLRDDSIAVLVPFDSRSYLLRFAKLDEAGKVKESQGFYKAWLTTVEGKTFLTAQPLYLKEALDGKHTPGFVVGRIVLAADRTKLTVRPINGDFPALAPLKKLPGHVSYAAPAAGEKTLSDDEARALFRKVIAENVDNEELYDKSGDFLRVTDKQILKAIFEDVIG
jgi:hypothetical protein